MFDDLFSAGVDMLRDAGSPTELTVVDNGVAVLYSAIVGAVTNDDAAAGAAWSEIDEDVERVDVVVFHDTDPGITLRASVTIPSIDIGSAWAVEAITSRRPKATALRLRRNFVRDLERRDRR